MQEHALRKAVHLHHLRARRTRAPAPPQTPCRPHIPAQPWQPSALGPEPQGRSPRLPAEAGDATGPRIAFRPAALGSQQGDAWAAARGTARGAARGTAVRAATNTPACEPCPSCLPGMLTTARHGDYRRTHITGGNAGPTVRPPAHRPLAGRCITDTVSTSTHLPTEPRGPPAADGAGHESEQNADPAAAPPERNLLRRSPPVSWGSPQTSLGPP